MDESSDIIYNQNSLSPYYGGDSLVAPHSSEVMARRQYASTIPNSCGLMNDF